MDPRAFYLLFVGVLATQTAESVASTTAIHMDVVLTKGSVSVSSDYDIVGPAISLAKQRSVNDFNDAIEPVSHLYTGGYVENELAGLTQVIRALNDSADFMLGPACTSDLVMAAKLTTIYKVPLLTGAGSIVENTRVWPYVTRTAYNSETQWSFFLSICRQFNWSNVAMLYEADLTNIVTLRSGESKCLMLHDETVVLSYHVNQLYGESK